VFLRYFLQMKHTFNIKVFLRL